MAPSVEWTLHEGPGEQVVYVTEASTLGWRPGQTALVACPDCQHVQALLRRRPMHEDGLDGWSTVCRCGVKLVVVND